jgi:DNA-binding HxlR family transcriptional regulator
MQTRNSQQVTPDPEIGSGCGAVSERTAYTDRISAVLQLFEGKWTIQILCTMRERPVRLSELKRAIPLASKKALTARLRSLESAGVVLRKDLSGSLLHVEYELAEAMRGPLTVLLDKIAEWGKMVL